MPKRSTLMPYLYFISDPDDEWVRRFYTVDDYGNMVLAPDLIGNRSIFLSQTH